MSSSESRERSVNSVSGKVVLKGTARGIPDLLVVVYDVDPGTEPEEIVERAVGEGGELDLNALGDRIGSVLTDATGAFSLDYDDQAFRIRESSERRPDLMLIVLAPERPGRTTADMVLYVPEEARQNAGRLEAYKVELDAEALRSAGVPVPEEGGPAPVDEDRDPEQAIVLRARLRAGKRLSTARADVLREEVEAAHQSHAETRTESFTASVRETLSAVPQQVRAGRRFVIDGASTLGVVTESMQTRLDEAFEQPPTGQDLLTVSGFVYLTEDQVSDYQSYIQGDDYVLPGDVLERDILPALYAGDGATSANDFVMDHPAVRVCQRKMRDRLGRPPHHDEQDEPAGNHAPAADSDPGTADEDDVARYVARQMRFMTPPEGPVRFGVGNVGLPTDTEIADHLGGLHLTPGPALNPAYFDLHVLNIAFDHVWQEALDQAAISKSEALYDEAIALGHRPKRLHALVNDVRSLTRFVKPEPSQQEVLPPVEVVMEFPDAVALWSQLTAEEKTAVQRIATAILSKYSSGTSPSSIWKDFLVAAADPVTPYLEKQHLVDGGGFEVTSVFRQKGQRILDAARDRWDERREAQSDVDRYRAAGQLAAELEASLQGRTSFTYFAADSVERSINYGVLLTYRQRWESKGYAAGELVRSIPLAPKETRKYTTRRLVKTSRSEKEIEENVRITKDDTSNTSRGESEIVRKAMEKSNFTLGSSSTFEVPLSEKIKIGNTITTNLTRDAQRDSSDTKKDFREAVVKASYEYKATRRTEISVDTVEEAEHTESGEISNPNDELTVTYLFYELQQQFQVNERLHRMRPVVLVAQEMPAPHEIDEEWILRHDWMIKRALLDDSFLFAFECIATVRGDELMLADLERVIGDQRKIVRDLRQNVRFFTEETGRMSRLMQAAIAREAAIVEDRDPWDGIPLLGTRMDAMENSVKGLGGLLGFGRGDDPKEAQRIRREGVKDAYERAELERRELMGRLEKELDLLNGMAREAAEKRKVINEKQVAIARLKNHLKDQVLHYMQAIWSYEHPEQRFFRLCNTQVPQLVATPGAYGMRISTEPVPSAPLDAAVNLGRPAGSRKVRHRFVLRPTIQVQEKTLVEVAELDNLLGFKGNYMIFPLRGSNPLTDFMMAPYVDSEFGLLDPDAAGNWNLEDFERLYRCLQEALGDDFDELEEPLKEFYAELLQDPLRQDELISVPTDSLMIEALPGEHRLLEEFKAMHRAVDVKKVQAEVRKLEMENIRYAARLLAHQHGDPDVEKRVTIERVGLNVDPEND